MTVSAIAARVGQTQTVQPGRINILGPGGETGAAGAPVGPPFGATMAQAIDRVDMAQKSADAQVEAFVAGETENVHDVMISMNQAELHFQMLTEVRNKLLEGYQEIMRMQI
ncbi:flagellar hook-basal body complex protein FliE [Rubrivirga sp.]|uniref:flagellar hook-basal body complex protein FliE n=1 Tax=Rubrivirga sp. TaxID=1885344 RepID=UPI003C7312C5